jgi:hypothetical protein
MKINEIIVESRVDEGPFLDRLKSVGQQAGTAIKQGAGAVANSNFVNSNSLLGGIKGAVQGAKSGVGVGQGFQAGVSRAQGTQFANQVVKIKMDKWNQALAQDPSLAQNAQALQDFMAGDADAKRAGFVPELPTDMSPKGVQAYITKTTGEIIAKRNLGLQHQPAGQQQPPAGQQQPPGPPVPPVPPGGTGQLAANQVQVGNEVVTKQQNGTWIDSQGQQIVNSAEISRLENLLTVQNQTRQMSQGQP